MWKPAPLTVPPPFIHPLHYFNSIVDPPSPSPPRAHRVLAEPLGINITAESFTEKGDTPFGPLERSGVPELLDGLHTFGIRARVEVRTEPKGQEVAPKRLAV